MPLNEVKSQKKQMNTTPFDKSHFRNAHQDIQSVKVNARESTRNVGAIFRMKIKLIEFEIFWKTSNVGVKCSVAVLFYNEEFFSDNVLIAMWAIIDCQSTMQQSFAFSFDTLFSKFRIFKISNNWFFSWVFIFEFKKKKNKRTKLYAYGKLVATAIAIKTDSETKSETQFRIKFVKSFNWRVNLKPKKRNRINCRLLIERRNAKEEKWVGF